nr:MAG TPA: C2H2 type zinc-finger protein [Caudoviricetes sp.]
MKELKLYQCEICGTKYAEKSKARECEKYHAKDLEITTRDYRGMNEGSGKFPVKIWVRSKDGTDVMYRR